MCLVLPLPIQASESIASVAIPVEQKISILHERPDNQTFEYVLKPLDASNPMPTNDSEYTFKMTGSETKLLDKITYVHAGIYSYELSFVEPEKVDGYTYDQQTYRVDVYVANTGDNGLTPSIVIQHAQGKCDSALFKHVYDKKIVSQGTNTSTELNTNIFIIAMFSALFAFVLLLIVRRNKEKK